MKYARKTIQELLKEEERLEARYNEIEDQCLKDGLPFSEFEKKVKDIAEDLYFIDKYKRLKQDPVVEYGKEWKGDTYTIEEFKSMARSKMLMDSDGYGYYATESAKSDVHIMPSDVIENIIRDDFSHVIWCNK